jgi:hypothetical protein
MRTTFSGNFRQWGVLPALFSHWRAPVDFAVPIRGGNPANELRPFLFALLLPANAHSGAVLDSHYRTAFLQVT